MLLPNRSFKDYMPTGHQDDDVNAILAGIMQGKSPLKKPHTSRPVVSARLPQEPAGFQPPPALEETHSPKRSFKKRYVIMPLLVLGLAVSGFFLRQPIASLVASSSPFSQQLVENIGFPLYYPAKLPAGFRIELNSIKAAEGVVVYVVSDESEEKIVSVSLQVQPEGLTLDGINQTVKADNLRKLITPNGEASVGLSSSEGRTIASILTGKTWVLINMEDGALSDSDVDLLLNNLKQAE